MSANLGLIFGRILGSVVLIIAISIPFSLWNTYACMHLWNWFMAPTFNIQPITFLFMWGLIITFTSIKGFKIANKDKTADKDWKETLTKTLSDVASGAIAVGFAFLMGYIIHRMI